jgi:hypothetical protein
VRPPPQLRARLLQHRFAVAPAGESIAQLRCHPIQDRGLEQELLNVVRLPAYDLLDQVVVVQDQHEVAGRAPEIMHECRHEIDAGRGL